jgi:hypothetical protein
VLQHLLGLQPPVCCVCCSFLAGSRPPAQLHGTLDGSGSGGVDAEEEQEIQKIISEIHGTGKHWFWI